MPGDKLGIPGMESGIKLPPHERSYNPATYPAAEREFLLLPVQQAKVVTPVVLSHPLVEAFYLEGSQGAVVTLANYGLVPIDKLSVTIHTRRKAQIESVRRGPLNLSRADATATVRLPLIDTDMLKVYWR